MTLPLDLVVVEIARISENVWKLVVQDGL